MKNTINELLKRLKISSLSECDLMEVMEHIEDAIYVTGKDTELIYMNRAAEELFGYTLEQMRGKKNHEINGKFERWYPSVLLSSYSEKKRYTQEQWSTYNGKKFLTTLHPVLDRCGDVTMVVSLSRVETYNVGGTGIKEHLTKNASYDLTGEILTVSPVMRSVLEQADKVAPLNATVLLTGNTGTGKNMLAKYIHDRRNIEECPFIMINCAAIPANIIESELFGYAPYTFSGSSPKGKKGLIAAAEGGTIFLDEIGEMPLELQPKILGFLQSQTYMQVGGRKEIRSNVRIIAATNKNLRQEVAAGRFREDLYWRLSVVELHVPELKDRREDIRMMAECFLAQCCKKYDFKRSFSESAFEALTNYDWPGNVRQLKNLVEKLSIIVESDVIYPKDFTFIENGPVPVSSTQPPKNPINEPSISLEGKKEELERQLVMDAYLKYKTCRMVAKHLQISTTKAHKLIHRYCRNRSAQSVRD